MVEEKPRMLVLGTNILNLGPDQVEFFSNRHYHDYALLVIDLYGALRTSSTNYWDKVTAGGTLSLPSEASRTLQRRIYEIGERVRAFTEGGGTCFVFLRRLPVLVGMGHDLDLNTLFPYGDLECSGVEGRNIEWARNTVFTDFGRQTAGYWYYNALMQTKMPQTPIAHVAGFQSHVVAADFPMGSTGRIVVLPVPNLAPDEREAFIDQLQSLYLKLNAVPTVDPLPKWTLDYVLPEENERAAEIVKTNASIKKLYGIRKVQEEKLREVQALKVLVGGTGTALEAAVDSALGELGLAVRPGKQKRVDRIAEWKETLFAIEVQGVKRGAAEDHARSLVIWMQEVAMEHQREPKGLLVVNCYREDAPADRSGDPWPAKVTEIAARQGICALTGLQLLNILLAARKSPAMKDEIVRRIIGTDGVLQGFDDWSLALLKRE